MNAIACPLGITDRVPQEGRQKLRNLVLLLSFAVFPITVTFLAPAPPIMSLKEGTANLSVMVLAAIPLSGILFRRAFCGIRVRSTRLLPSQLLDQPDRIC